MKLNLCFPEMNGLKSLVKISCKIDYVTTPVKTITLRKGKDAKRIQLCKNTVLKILTIPNRNFNAAFDVSFSKYTEINKNERYNNKIWQTQLTPVPSEGNVRNFSR